MKRNPIRFCFLTLSLILLFSACHKRSYRNDLSAAELAGSLSGVLGMDADFGDGSLLSDQIEVPESADLTVCTAKSGMNIDEFGIWRADNPAEARRLLETYLEESYRQNKSYYDSYIPEQTAKLRDAEVRVFGSYAVYAILNPEQKAVFFPAAEKLLSSDPHANIYPYSG